MTGMLSRIFGGERKVSAHGAGDNHSSIIDDFWYSRLVSGMGGSTVTPDSAMQLSAVLACVRVISETIASLPLHVYERLEKGGKNKVRDHRYYNVLHTQPNGWQTAFDFWDMLVGHVCLRGTAYAEIVPQTDGTNWLVPLHPDKVRVYLLSNGDLTYKVQRGSGEHEFLLQDEVFRVVGLPNDGMTGLSPIDFNKRSIALSLSQEQFGESVYENGAMLGGIIETPTKLNEKDKKSLRESFEDRHQGSKKAGKIAVFDAGMKWHTLGMTMEQAKWIDARKYGAEDIARIFRVPQHLIGLLQHSTNNNIEYQGIEFVQHTIRPWCVRIEQATQRDVIRDPKYFAEFSIDGLLRGDSLSRAQAMQTELINGKISLDEWREMDNQNPIEGGLGKMHFIQRNLMPLEQANQPVPVAAPAPAQPQHPGQQPPQKQKKPNGRPKNSEADATPERTTPAIAASDVISAWIDDAAGRIVAAETRAIEQRIDKADGDRVKFATFLDTVYASQETYITRTLTPIGGPIGWTETQTGDIAKEIVRKTRFSPVSESAEPEFKTFTEGAKERMVVAISDMTPWGYGSMGAKS